MCEQRCVQDARLKRLSAWRAGDGETVAAATGLLKPLVAMIGEYVVPFQHVWAPPPPSHRKDRVCSRCLVAPSPTFLCCNCFYATYQHAAGRWTLAEGGPEWTIRVNTWYWKVGVLIEDDAAKLSEVTLSDSLADPAITTVHLNNTGTIMSAGRWASRIEREPISMLTKIVIDCDLESSKIKFAMYDASDETEDVLLGAETVCSHFDISHARPFVQLSQSYSHPATATIS